MASKNILPLKGQVQHYAWGGYTFIPELLHLENKENKPFAEYWMGAHPKSPSSVKYHSEAQKLNELIAADPEKFINAKVMNRFGELPYLFKVLDIRSILSIQVHPTKEEAEKGFDKEEKNGISISDPARNYKDRNHKPEVMIAIDETWLLHGFRNADSLISILKQYPEFEIFLEKFGEGDYKTLYQFAMELPQDQINAILKPILDRAFEQKLKLAKESPDYWFVKYYAEEPNVENIDKGIFSIFFFNIVKVLPGGAVFQAAGLPHAYMEGHIMELMANSDNVLRGGLTPKHVDIPELLKHTHFEGITPNIMNGQLDKDQQLNYPCPIPDFGITKIPSNYHSPDCQSESMEIIFVLKDDLKIQDLADNSEQTFHKGEALAILPNTKYALTISSTGEAYKAFVPSL